MSDALLYRPFEQTIIRESRGVVSNTHLPLSQWNEVAEIRRPLRLRRWALELAVLAGAVGLPCMIALGVFR